MKCPFCEDAELYAVGVLKGEDKQVMECGACDTVIIAKIPQAEAIPRDYAKSTR